MTDESNSLTLAADGVEPHAAPQIPEAGPWPPPSS